MKNNDIERLSHAINEMLRNAGEQAEATKRIPWRHRLRHRLGLQPVRITSQWRGQELWIGAKCTICGETTDWHDATHELPPWA